MKSGDLVRLMCIRGSLWEGDMIWKKIFGEQNDLGRKNHLDFASRMAGWNDVG